MDNARFDALSRTLARLGPRRSALKALAALVAGGLAANRRPAPAAAQQSCTFPSDCDNSNPCTTVDCVDGACTSTSVPDGSECTPGKSCQNGVCRCGRVQERCNGTIADNDCCSGETYERTLRCVSTPLGDKRCCRPTGAKCTANSDCCNTDSMFQGCRNDACCRLPGSACYDDDLCCGDAICRNQTCCNPDDTAITCRGKCGKVRNNCGQTVNCGCCPLRSVCNDANDCCQQFGPTECRTIHGSSQKGCCRESGEVCGRDGECCGLGVCRGSGRNARCCKPPRSPCHRDGECCGAGICRNQLCCQPHRRAPCEFDNDCCGTMLCLFGRCAS